MFTRWTDECGAYDGYKKPDVKKPLVEQYRREIQARREILIKKLNFRNHFGRKTPARLFCVHARANNANIETCQSLKHIVVSRVPTFFEFLRILIIRYKR